MNSLASRMQLPPSPELGPSAPAPTTTSTTAVTGASTTITAAQLEPRLRSVARYASYRPQTLTTSRYLPSCKTSLGAAAGTAGVAIFQVSHPQTPLALLHHHTAADMSTRALAFAPSAERLAGARTSGVLVWDVVTASAPLQARAEGPSSAGGPMTSVAWLTDHVVTAHTATTACLWDLRQPVVRTKPTVRWGTRTGATSTITGAVGSNRMTAPYVQLAVDTQQQHQVALLDASGIVRVWDTRYFSDSTTTATSSASNRSTSGGGGGGGGSIHTTTDTLYSMQAMRSVGVGLEAASHGTWVVWGYDNLDEPAVTRVLGPHHGGAVEDNSTTITTPKDEDDAKTQYHVWTELVCPHLTCTRVCDDHFVTLMDTSYKDNDEDVMSSLSWQASVYQIQPTGTVQPVVSWTSSSSSSSTARQQQQSQQFGSVCAADLALSTFGPTSVEPGTLHYPSRTSGLMLVQLTQHGYVTTHSIPEAMESLPMEKSDGVPAAPVNTATTMQSQTVYQQPNVGSLKVSAAPRIISEDRDLGDVAKAWTPRENQQNHSTTATTGVHGAGLTSDVDPLMGTHSGLPFDMDVPVAYGIPSSDAALRLSEPTVPGVIPAGDERTAAIADQSGLVMADARRIPCPRLCGASFGPGGALTLFGNGEVQRMWTWYCSSSSQRPDCDFMGRRAVAPGGKRGLRTMHDLQNMVKAAKDAQWGEQNSEEDASSVTSQQLGLGFFDDGGSEESSLADEESIDDLVETVTAADDKTKGLYGAYFGDFRRPLTRTSSTDSGLPPISSSDRGDSMGGPSSDMLAPVVKVISAFAKTVMHHQSRELATRWHIGDLDTVVRAKKLVTDLDSSVSENDSHRLTTLSPPRFLLPDYRIQQSPGRLMTTTRSDARVFSPGRLRPRSPGATNPYDVDEAGVHGGEYSVRPQMKESMVFLKKLVNYQQESGGIAGSSGFRGLMSPPDGPIQPKTVRPARPQKSSSPMKQGAYVLYQPESIDDSNLTSIKDICEHNARVSVEAKEQKKAETWKLLAQVSSTHVVGPSRWRPKTSFAVGRNLVRLILQYYERKGDVQMLATIVCVLRQGTQGGTSATLLPDKADARYDAYLQRYSDILYSWGLLSLRAEINKRLRFECESREVFGVPSKGNLVGGIDIFSECPHCHQPTTTNYCSDCSDYAFRCTLCDNAVRGLFTVCSDCGHGGHISHLRQWFATQRQCPTGCGCRCVSVVPQT